MKTRDEMIDEIQAMYVTVSRQSKELPEGEREAFGGTLAGLLMALRVVCVDGPVDTLDAMAAVRSGISAAHEYRKAAAS
jgi:hypothetical protein